MRFKMEVEMDNAAFHDEETGAPDTYELVSIMRRVATSLDNVGFPAFDHPMPLRDVNGNTIGQWEVTA